MPSNITQCKQHPTINYILFINFKSDRYSCAIPDPDNDEVFITGGAYARTTVSVYNKDGHLQDLADLRQGRFYHACSMFDGNDGNEKVNDKCKYKDYSDHRY